MSAIDKISLKATIITALISFLISGFGGYFLNDLQTRAKPELIVSSIGFSPGDELIEIEATLLGKSADSSWMRSFKKFESYDSIDQEYKRLVRIEKRLKKGTDITEKWLKENKNWSTGEVEQVRIQELIETPYCQDDIVGSNIIGSMRRNEIDMPPVTFEKLQALPDIAELYRDNSGWRIHLGRQGTGFPDDDAKGRQSKKSIEILAISFAKGSAKNIYYYINWFINETYRDLQAVQDLISEIEEILLPAAHLRIDVSIYNNGNSPVTLKPYMAMYFLNEELKNHSIILHYVKNQENERAESTDVKVSSYLPESIGSQYIFIQPNNGENITLSSNIPLGREKGEQILSLFNANALRSKVISISSEGHSIVSPAFFFGKNISKDDEKLINDVVSSQ